MYKHSFNVQVAIDYSIEKAVLLDNFFYWCQQNAANGKNIHRGRAYTYNTAEAFAQLFPYLKARKIAELLRQMELDGLLLSAQTQGTNRVKSYTLTDKALEYYTSVAEAKTEQCNVQNSELPTYENPTLEDTEFKYCSIANNKQTNNKQHIDTPAPEPDAPKKEAKHKHGTQANVLLTDTELQKLNEEYTSLKTTAAIEYLSLYKAEKNYKTKSDYLTLKRWVFKALEEQAQRRGSRPPQMTNDIYTGNGSDW
jgi:DNA-binding PadR family transcriptional regulator